MFWFQERLEGWRYRTDGLRDRFSYRGPSLYDLRYRFGERRAQAAYNRDVRRRFGGSRRYRWADLAPTTRKLTAAAALFALVTAGLVAVALSAGTERATSGASSLNLTPTTLPLLLVPNDEPTTSTSSTTPTLPPPVETVETTVAPVAPTTTVAKATTTTRKSTPTTKKSTPTTKAPTRVPSATSPTTKPPATTPTSPPTSPTTTAPTSPSTTITVGAP